MLILNPHLTEGYFINGLSKELRPIVKMLQPRSIKHAAKSSRLQEMTVKALMKKHQLLAETHLANSSQLERNPNHRVYANPNSAIVLKGTRRSEAQRVLEPKAHEARRAFVKRGTYFRKKTQNLVKS